MRKLKYALLVTLILGAATLADGIEVLRVEGIEVLSTGESIVTTRVGQVAPGSMLQGVMTVDGIEVLVMEMPVGPEGGMFPVHFPVHQAGNRVQVVDVCGLVVASDYVDAMQND